MPTRKSSRATTTLSVGLLLAIGTLFCAQQFSTAAPMDEETAKLVAQMVPRYHLNQVRIDDTLSEQLFNKYFKDLDPQKLYFLKSDIDGFAPFKTALDDGIRKGDVEFAYAAFETYRKRVDERLVIAERLVDGDFDFTTNDAIARDADDLDWAASAAEMEERWRLRVKYDVLQLKLADESMEEIRNRLHKRYRNIRLNIDQTEPTDVLEIYLSTMLNCFDPHSSYMSPNTLEDFQISMRLSLDGIGAALRSEDGYTIVAEVVAGGAADKDGRLQIGDKVIGVAQEGEEEFTDIVDMKLRNVVRLIRGDRGTKVRLQVKPETGDTQVYELVRQKIELKESEVKGEVIETNDRVGRTGRIGVIKIPAFYRDFAGAASGGEFKSASRDVARVLRGFHRQGGVDGLVIDLRNNGGGALTEAIEVSGHFIDKGPVVQVKAPDGNVTKHNDEEPGVLYSGPLVVICNRAAASASEIFAGVIKDYNRGIVVGDTTTHGKGTVQNVMPVAPNEMLRIFSSPDRGALKLTIQQFYRVNGDSTQNRGVTSDVVLPSVFDHWDIGEAYLDNALPFDRIPEAAHASVRQVDDQIRSDLQSASAARVSKDESFAKISEAIRRYLERKSRKTISLNEDELRRERDEDAKLADAVDELKSDDAVDAGETPTVDDEKKKEKTAEDEAPFPQNFYNDEVLHITLDYLGKLRELRTVQR